MQELSTDVDLEPGCLEHERAQGDTEAWRAFNGKAEEWAAQALAGDASACALLLKSPVELKRWLDAKAGRVEGEGALREMEHMEPCGYLRGERRPERFLERGLPSDAEALRGQYAALGTKTGRADFKSDVQGIERAILGGSIEALREMIERSPMALWAMDFTLSEYESENVLAFAAKYAPAGADVVIIGYLRSLGARLTKASLNYVVGEAMARSSGIWRKSPKHVADAFEAAGHVFAAVDGYAMLRHGAMERVATYGMASVARQKVEWLEEMEGRGVNWAMLLSAEQCQQIVGELAVDPRKPQREAEFVEHARAEGAAGLGAWVGLSGAALRDVEFWREMGPFLAKRGLAKQALRAASLSGAGLTWGMVLPYAEAQEISETVLRPGVASVATRALRI